MQKQYVDINVDPNVQPRGETRGKTLLNMGLNDERI